MSQRIPLIAGNWKMYKTLDEAVQTARLLVEVVGDLTDREAMIAPPFTALASVYEVVKGSAVALGAQNFFWEKEGAYTGEVSAAMLVSAGCRYVIIGHSERRQYFNETDETVNRKLGAAIQNALIPVVCVGETENEREADETFSVLDKQVAKGLNGYSAEELKPLIIAYEPVWAIGTGKTATPDQAQEAHQFIRGRVEALLGKPLADATRILYGGSVKPDNVDELMGMPDIDGGLVGGASLKAEIFSKIIHFRAK